MNKDDLDLGNELDITRALHDFYDYENNYRLCPMCDHPTYDGDWDRDLNMCGMCAKLGEEEDQ